MVNQRRARESGCSFGYTALETAQNMRLNASPGHHRLPPAHRCLVAGRTAVARDLTPARLKTRIEAASYTDVETFRAKAITSTPLDRTLSVYSWIFSACANP